VRYRRLVPIALLLAVGAIALALVATHGQPRGATIPDDGDAGRPEQPDATGPFPKLDHIYLIVLENHDLASVIGSASAPYLNSLVAKYGLATEYLAVARPSQPNYIALFSGSTQQIADNDVHDIQGPNLADQLDAHGRTWRVFAENDPGGCFVGPTASGGPDGDGSYVRKHEPAISFTDISSNASRCGNIRDFSAFDPAAADFELIIPNLCHNMHDCSVAVGDQFMAGFVPRILNSPAFGANSALFVTFDEGDSQSGDQHVATMVAGAGVPPGMRSSVAHTHYSLLRSIEDSWGLGCLDETCDANNLGEFFPGGAVVSPAASSPAP
jgi:phosphatidylinositol-3-phosphatase